MQLLCLNNTDYIRAYDIKENMPINKALSIILAILHDEQQSFFDQDCLEKTLKEYPGLEKDYQKTRKKLINNPRKFSIDSELMKCFNNDIYTMTDIEKEKSWFWRSGHSGEKFNLDKIEEKIIKELENYPTLKHLMLESKENYLGNLKIQFAKLSPLIIERADIYAQFAHLSQNMINRGTMSLSALLKNNKLSKTLAKKYNSNYLILTSEANPTLILTEDKSIKENMRLANGLATTKYHAAISELA